MKTRIVFCREGRRIEVRTGIGRASIARSVTIYHVHVSLTMKWGKVKREEVGSNIH